MSVLDLQGMTSPTEEMGLYGKGGRRRPPGGGASAPSTLSVVLCGHNSGLSLLIC